MARKKKKGGKLKFMSKFNIIARCIALPTCAVCTCVKCSEWEASANEVCVPSSLALVNLISNLPLITLNCVVWIKVLRATIEGFHRSRESCEINHTFYWWRTFIIGVLLYPLLRYMICERFPREVRTVNERRGKWFSFESYLIFNTFRSFLLLDSFPHFPSPRSI